MRNDDDSENDNDDNSKNENVNDNDNFWDKASNLNWYFCFRFVIKEKSLSLSDLDDIWAAQAGKHEAIVKNVRDLLAKLAGDFSSEQLDHLFECFQVG